MKPTKLTTREPFTHYVPFLRNGVDFDTNGALRGRADRARSFGGLPYTHYVSVENATYVVYSYYTPIAWQNPDGTWTVPAVKYSNTTSHHQSRIRPAVAVLDPEFGEI